LNHLDDARSLCEQLIGRGHDDTFIHLNLFAIATLRHDKQALSREYEWAKRHPDDIPMLYDQAKAEAAMGEVNRSTELFEEAAKLTAARGDSEEAANVLATSAEINSEMGRTALAQKESEEAVRLGKSQTALFGTDRRVRWLTSAEAVPHV